MIMANQFPNSGVELGDASAPRNYYDQLKGVSAFESQALFGFTHAHDCVRRRGRASCSA